MLQLVSLEITDYRAIKHGLLDFGQTTVIIGENRSGKATLLEALATTLDPALDDKLPVFKQLHFRQHSNKSILEKKLCINLRLRLNKSQNSGELEVFQLFPTKADGPVTTSSLFEITFNSVLSPAGIQTDWKCSNLRDGSNTSNPFLLRALRQLIPVVWLKRAALLGYNANEQILDISTEPAEDRITQLKQQICYHAAEVIQGRTTNQNASVANGFEAVKSLAAELKRDATN
ncbi:MAG: AAA family ATPase, partial [Flavobacteriaceae bacterium]